MEKQLTFFDKNKGFYGTTELYPYDYFFLKFIKANIKKKSSMVDIGGGGGAFTKLCQDHIQNLNISIVDPSIELLHKQNIEGVKLIVGRLPDELNVSGLFDFIHIKEVLHHITGKSIKDSKKMVKKSLISVQKILKNDGYLLIHEEFDESWIIPTLTRSLIFYILKIQNKLHIKIPSKHFKLGLETCFYTRHEIELLLNEVDLTIVDYYEERWKNNLYKKLLFLKDWGRMCFVIKKR